MKINRVGKEMAEGREPAFGLKKFVREFLGEPGSFIPIAGDGSQRIFWRVAGPHSALSFIAMENAPTDDFSKRENAAYLNIGRHLRKKGLPLPEIHRVDLDRGWFLMEDFGDVSLQAACERAKERIPLYAPVVDILFQQQVRGSEGFDTAWACQTKVYDRQVMRRYEVDYFKEAFLGTYLGFRKEWPELEDSFEHLIEEASKAENQFFLHRDFQSRNIMLKGGKIGILDWQGGRLGPLAYDLASLLIDPYTELPVPEKEEIYNMYVQLLRQEQPHCLASFEKSFPYLALQRNLQILGAFSFLSRVRGKTYFEGYIPGALKSLRRLLATVKDGKLSSLRDLVNSLPDSLCGPAK
ncbi:MAG TPA: phosphotransferase [Desulfatiglandales bacterium]|nr:phosphotransferase [Desulfatiglandales bacterium]